MFSSCVCFVFTETTSYEMRISVWISDLCSSDLQQAVPGRVVAEHDDEVRPPCVRRIDDLGPAVERHVGLAEMRVGKRRDPQLQAGGPAGRPHLVTLHA